MTVATKMLLGAILGVELEVVALPVAVSVEGLPEMGIAVAGLVVGLRELLLLLWTTK